jgi:hypothetical protein
MGLDQGPLSLVRTTEELLERKSSGSGLENRDYDRRRSAALPMRQPSIRKKKLALTSPKNGSRSVGIVLSRTQATEFLLFRFYLILPVFYSVCNRNEYQKQKNNISGQ